MDGSVILNPIELEPLSLSKLSYMAIVSACIGITLDKIFKLDLSEY